MEKKKTELALKARKEIADYIRDGKVDRAKIRVEHIIREDYIVEAMELVEMYCDLLLARFGLLQQMKELDEGLKEAISSLIWVALRLQTDCAELKLISDQLTVKYGKPYAMSCLDNSVGTVLPKLMQKMSVQAPPKILDEEHLEELIDLGGDRNNLGGGGGASGGGGGGGGSEGGHVAPPGFIGYPYMPVVPGRISPQPSNFKPFQYPAIPQEELRKQPLDIPMSPPFSPMNIPASHNMGGFVIPSGSDKELNFNYQVGGADIRGPRYDSLPPPYSFPTPPSAPKDDSKPKPAPRSKLSPGNNAEFLDLPDLPAVPSTNPSSTGVGGRDHLNKIESLISNFAFMNMPYKHFPVVCGGNCITFDKVATVKLI
ncbi:unnamed protein product [Allacma fusca]|uniref:IST1 homolog n=1 Tax=Allacma fusca TaxID=39272 RepID=A0A8J2P6Z6_9HEXA|nr:unnamed protein product [Allacma fusca]